MLLMMAQRGSMSGSEGKSGIKKVTGRDKNTERDMIGVGQDRGVLVEPEKIRNNLAHLCYRIKL